MPPCYIDLPIPRKTRIGVGILVVVATLLLPGCTRLRYYLQATHGEMRLLGSARPIPQVIADPHTPTRLRHALEQAQAMRRFAIHVLHLPDNGSFRDYAPLSRRYVVWNVFAAPRFSVHLIHWCFPVAGCVPYRGYFSHAQAKRYAQTLAQRGDDVYLAGVPTFSTLGWMPDPLLSTELYRSPEETAGLMFHELAHALLYVPGDPVFNESFAVTVQETGVRRWLLAAHDPQALRRYDRSQRFDETFGAAVTRYRRRLDGVYREGGPRKVLEARKRRLFSALSQTISRAGRCFGFHVRVPAPLNNATLGALATYTDLVPAFHEILRQDRGHLVRFYATVRRISHWPKARRTAWLRSRLPVSAARLCVRPVSAGTADRAPPPAARGHGARDRLPAVR
ncbi:MAG: aminopeptidase [Acidiferrobacteraceae bacterium]